MVEELGVKKDLGLLAVEYYSAFAPAVCTTPRYAALHCGVVLPIRQPFISRSFFIFYCGVDCKRNFTKILANVA